ncbi:unnamed protein product [Bursaphelenchus okinawaensis]|uniref:ACB domain-containing protein n=1 Tax=Bursaphelenchus okinawaensis TaxID=465554 RepID=A0A811LDW6_9BILA|nr:unnamed protein product [Bursaphelenchus okinawaensis]CAG9121423.1 unnamed protein product [Bursaphelenchus okinawaensis]
MAENGDAQPEITADSVELIFGLPLERVHKIGMKYYKDNEKTGKLQVDYPIRLKFMAYSKQARYGVYKDELTDVGWFDLVGNDAKKEWQKLGEISREEAMLEFVRLLDVVCPTFKPFVKEQAALEAPKLNGKSAYLNGKTDSQEVIEKYQQQKKQIQEALNKQTYHQFLAYAQQNVPGDPEKDLATDFVWG